MEIKDKVAQDCINLIAKKMAKEMTPEEYYIALYELDRKYPYLDFKQVAELYIRHQKAVEKQTKPRSKIDYKMRSSGEREPGEEG